MALRCPFRRAPDVGHHHGRIRGGFDEHDARVARRADRVTQARAISGGHGDTGDAERFQKFMNQPHGAAIRRNGVDDRARRPREREECRHDGGHPGIKHRGFARAALERDHLIFQNFGVGVRDARINQVRAFALFGRDTITGNGERPLGGFRTGENVGGAAKHGGPRRPKRQAGIETAREHFGRRPKRSGTIFEMCHNCSFPEFTAGQLRCPKSIDTKNSPGPRFVKPWRRIACACCLWARSSSMVRICRW